MKLETRRLILRPPKKDDWRDIVEGVGDIDVARNLLVVPHPYHKKDALNFIKHCIKANKEDPNHNNFFIELKSEGKVIGQTGVGPSHDDKTVAVTGSWINKNYWRKGYVLEAKVPVLDLIFNKLKYRKIETAAYTDNSASNGMSRALGFKLEGTKRRSVTCRADGRVHDENLYGMFKKDWLKRRPIIIRELAKKAKKYSS